MWIRSVQLRNFKGFADSGSVGFGRRTNVLVGPNNAGKSSLVQAIYLLQDPTFRQDDIRLGTDAALVDISLDDLAQGYVFPDTSELFKPYGRYEPTVHFRLARNVGQATVTISEPDGSNERGFGPAPQNEPGNLLYPYLSKRKVSGFSEEVNLGATAAVVPDLRYLNARVDRLIDPNNPASELFARACHDILNLRIGSNASPNGKRAGLVVDQFTYVPLESLGEGVASILGLVTCLCVANGKVFLIEEPENDIHPLALKSLLELITEVADTNQFIVTTHSNIVTQFLGAGEGSSLVEVNSELVDRMPVSTASLVPSTYEARRTLLERLGYEYLDVGLWQGWLILEESSAETIVREYLIPWLVPELANRLRTIAAGGVDRVEPKFADFDRLFLFVHLAPAYTNRAWVLIDSGPRGDEVVASLIERYTPSGWEESSFQVLREQDFERYYPARFSEEADRALALSDRRQRREAKKALLAKVIAWVEEDQAAARSEFERSAAEVVTHLRRIADILKGVPPVSLEA